jgi:hypothetical protein
MIEAQRQHDFSSSSTLVPHIKDKAWHAGHENSSADQLVHSRSLCDGLLCRDCAHHQEARTEPQSEIINFYFFLLTTVVFLVFSLFKGTHLVISTGSIKWFALLAIVAAAANYFSVTAIRAAPNPGYVTGIRAFETVIIAVVAVFVFQIGNHSHKVRWDHSFAWRFDFVESVNETSWEKSSLRVLK